MAAQKTPDWPQIVSNAALAMSAATGRSTRDCLVALTGLVSGAEPSDARPHRTRAIAYLLNTQQVKA